MPPIIDERTRAQEIQFGRPLNPWPEQGNQDPLKRDSFFPGSKMPLRSHQTYVTMVDGIDGADVKFKEVTLSGIDNVPASGRNHGYSRLIIVDSEGNPYYIDEIRFRNEFRMGSLPPSTAH